MNPAGSCPRVWSRIRGWKCVHVGPVRANSWREWIQTKRLQAVVRKVVFDPDAETRTATLVDDAAARLE